MKDKILAKILFLVIGLFLYFDKPLVTFGYF